MLGVTDGDFSVGVQFLDCRINCASFQIFVRYQQIFFYPTHFVQLDGTEHLAARKQEVDALFARLAELATVQQRTDGGPVRRAMQNLRMVLINRLERGEAKAETLHDMAAILDEAAQKIERL